VQTISRRSYVRTYSVAKDIGYCTVLPVPLAIKLAASIAEPVLVIQDSLLGTAMLARETTEFCRKRQNAGLLYSYSRQVAVRGAEKISNNFCHLHLSEGNRQSCTLE
jgi:hypothetical protein